MAGSGIFQGVCVYITEEERDRLARAFAAWPSTPTRILTFREPHEGMVCFVLHGQRETASGCEGAMVAKSIQEQIGAQPTCADCVFNGRPEPPTCSKPGALCSLFRPRDG